MRRTSCISAIRLKSPGFSFSYTEDRRGDDFGSPAQLQRVWTNFILDPLNATFAQPKKAVEDVFDVFQQTSDFRNFGNHCVAYLDATNGKLMAVTFIGGEPGVTAVTNAPNGVSPTSRGKLRIAFGDDKGVKLARHEINRWEIDEIDSAANPFASP